MKRDLKASGQSLIEFALLLPLFLLLIMALFDIGRAVFYYAVLNTAVREGTRFAIVQSDCDYRNNPVTCTGGYPETYPLDCENAISLANTTICQEIREKHFSISELNDSTVIITRVTNVDNPYMRIEIDFPFTPVTPGLNLIGEINLQVNSQMLITPIAQP